MKNPYQVDPVKKFMLRNGYFQSDSVWILRYRSDMS